MVAFAATARRAFEIAEGVLPLTGGRSSRVDETACVIHDVKVAGFESRNLGRTIGLLEDDFGEAANLPYSYSKEAFERALPLYEDCRVIIRHPKFEYDERTGQRFVTDDRDDEDSLVGWLRNVRVTESGVFADLHYLRTHPFSARLVEVAQRNPSKLALSHEAFFENPCVVNGRIVLTEITHVDCVAIVAGRPGTTNSLFESAATQGARAMKKKRKVRTVIESLPPAHRRRKLLLEMLGDGQSMAPMADMEIESADDASPEDAVKAAFRAIINKVLDEATSADEAAKKIKDLLDAQDAAVNAASGAAGSGGGSGSGSGSASASGTAAEGGKPNTAESAGAGAGNGSGSASGTASVVVEAAKVDRSQAILESGDLLATAGLAAPAIVLEAMSGLPDRAARERYVAAMPKPSAAQGDTIDPATGLPVVPRSAPPPKGGTAAESAANNNGGAGNGGADKYAQPGALAAAIRG